MRDTRAIARKLGASAIVLFAQKGFDQVKVSEIAARAGVTSRTFFRYFPTKETVVVDIWTRANTRLMELIRTSGGADADAPGVLAEAVVRWYEEQGDLMPALARLSDESETLTAALLLRVRLWEERIAEALRGRFPGLGPEDAEVWGVTAMAMINLSQRRSVAAGVSLADAAREVFRRFDDLTADRGGGVVPGPSRRAG
ncbi:hypothetical protein PZ61_0236020 [Streptomyces sp. MNU77]|nr:hypothetical protein PZ61_0236020 [Streptomyces sp. MNU77]